MEYRPVDRVPNWELGVWPQTRERWEREGANTAGWTWDWFTGEEALGMDAREFIPVNTGMMPAFTPAKIAEDTETETFRDERGRVRTALKAGTVSWGRMSMDTYERFPVETPEDWQSLKKRYDARLPRLAADWAGNATRWRTRTEPLIFGRNCQLLGFYWIAREWMGTENLSLAWYDHPGMMHDMMAFWADFLIEIGRPVVAATTLDYICLNEDLSMKNGPLLSPATYREFIFPHLRRVVEFYKTHGCRSVAIDTDGNPEAVVPLFMEAGVDILWPLERASEQDPVRLRQKFGKSLRLWGGVDKRELAKDRAAIDAHLRSLRPIVEHGGYIPTVDHTVPPDVSWDNFRYYMEQKTKLLAGKL